VPVTRSEWLFFTAGVVVGAVGHANYPKLKEKLAPLAASALAGLSSTLGEQYAEMARKVAEKVEEVQDTMAAMKQASATVNGATSSPGPEA
jgi:hypothetical protein